MSEGQKWKTLARSSCEFVSPAYLTEQGQSQDHRSSHIFTHPGMLMAHSFVPYSENLISQFFYPTAAQEYKTMQLHKILQE